VKLLDHGSVELIETWGSDERIIEAARMSTNKGFQGWGPKACPTCVVDADPAPEDCACSKCGGTCSVPGDEKLLRYLWEHDHYTPFEMGGATVEVQAPIFVFREWHRHRTQSYNELSARYTPMPDVNYLPTVERMLISGGANKQAQSVGGAFGEPPLEEQRRVTFGAWSQDLSDLYARAEHVYQSGLRAGVPKEIARLAVTVGRYSRMRASANLRNWLGFLKLRMAENAQWEIRQYANAVHSVLSEKFPRTLALFDEGRA
jgi:thymidylate synthase (FAD)